MLLALTIIAVLVAVVVAVWQLVSALRAKKNFDNAVSAFDSQFPVLKYLNDLQDVKSDYKITIMEKLNLNIGVMKKVVEILETNGMITSTTTSLFLTDFGKKYVEVFGKEKSEPTASK